MTNAATNRLNRIRFYAGKHGASVQPATARTHYGFPALHGGGTLLVRVVARGDGEAFVVTTRPGRHYVLRELAGGEWGVQRIPEGVPSQDREVAAAISFSATAKTATAAIACIIGVA